MASTSIDAQHTTVTAATNLGIATVSSSTGFKPGAFVWLSNTAGTVSWYCKVTSVPDATHVALRHLPDPGKVLEDRNGMGANVSYPNYSNSDISSFNAGGFLDQEAQQIYVTNADNSLPTKAEHG